MKLESGHGHTGTTTHQQSPVVDHVDYSRVGKGSADYHAHGMDYRLECRQVQPTERAARIAKTDGKTTAPDGSHAYSSRAGARTAG